MTYYDDQYLVPDELEAPVGTSTEFEYTAEIDSGDIGMDVKFQVGVEFADADGAVKIDESSIYIIEVTMYIGESSEGGVVELTNGNANALAKMVYESIKKCHRFESKATDKLWEQADIDSSNW